MTYKEKKTYLEGYRQSIRNIQALQTEYRQWQTIATGITSQLKPVVAHTNDNSSKVENCALKCLEIQEKIELEIRASEQQREEIFNTINNVKDMRRRELLTMRYISGMSVHKIAIVMDKADDNIYKMLRTTIKNINLQEEV